MFRHGDVQIIPMAEKPEGELQAVQRDNGRAILAYGEVTGHAHAIEEDNVFLWKTKGANDNDELFLEIRERPVCLRHEEHKTITLKAGWYRRGIKRQYDENHGWNNVQD